MEMFNCPNCKRETEHIKDLSNVWLCKRCATNNSTVAAQIEERSKKKSRKKKDEKSEENPAE